MSVSFFPDLSSMEVAPERNAWEPVPAGTYQAKVRSAEYGATSARSKNPGAPMLICDWEITDGDHQGKTVRNWTVFTFKDRINPELVAHLRAAGLYPSTKAEIVKALGVDRVKTFNLLLTKIIGCEATIEVTEQEGRIRTDLDGNNIPKVDPSTGEIVTDENGDTVWERWPSRSNVNKVAFPKEKKSAKSGFTI